jgi:DNA-binding MarR family transcriptional regulator
MAGRPDDESSAQAEDARDAWRHMTELFLSGQVHECFDAACASVDLPHPGSLRALMLLRPEDAPSMRAMAAALHCDASYITGLVDALEARRYVERQTSPHDRRVKQVQLTAAGQAAQQRALEAMLTPPRGFAALNAAETRTLAQLMRRIAADCPATLCPGPAAGSSIPRDGD